MYRSEIVYKIFLHWNYKTNKYDTYSLAETDEWNEEYFKWMKEGVSLEEIFITLDLNGIRDKLVNLETWEENLLTK